MWQALSDEAHPSRPYLDFLPARSDVVTFLDMPPRYMHMLQNVHLVSEGVKGGSLGKEAVRERGAAKQMFHFQQTSCLLG